MRPIYSVASTVSASGGSAHPQVNPPSVVVSASVDVEKTMPVSGSVYVPRVACAKAPGATVKNVSKIEVKLGDAGGRC